MSLISKFLHKVIRQGVLTIVYPDGTQEQFGTPKADWPQATLRFHHRRAYAAILRDPALGLAESYMNGDVSIDHDRVLDVISLYRRNTAVGSARGDCAYRDEEGDDFDQAQAPSDQ